MAYIRSDSAWVGVRGEAEIHSRQDVENLKPEMDVTRFYYDEATGLLTNKVYADSHGPIYEYDVMGRLVRRTWARGVTTDYSYDLLGQLTNINYSDSTPDVSFTYDRLGRPLTIRDVLGTRTNEYEDPAYGVKAEKLPDGTVLTRSYDELGRPAGVRLGADYAVTYSYDSVGRLAAVTASVARTSFGAEYSYVVDSGLLAGYRLTPGGSTSTLAVTRSYEANRNMLVAITNAWDGALISAFEYENNAAGRRVRRWDVFTSARIVLSNEFGYNARSELIEAGMWTNRYSYRYDAIGNRTVVTNNGEVWQYLANELNQYTDIHDGVTNRLTYDLDGNLTNYNGWTFEWDGENRLIFASNGTTVVQNVYDYMSRRVKKVVNGVTNGYDYDGWAMIRENKGAKTNLYVWGLDLSGTLQGAGGVGGLLAVNGLSPSGLAIPCYDANGNVSEYIASSDGSLVCRFRYDPYGNLTEQSGVRMNMFPLRFSTKYWDGEVGVYYYGHRSYQPTIGRWLNRDPVAEQGGLNINVFVANRPVILVDTDGQSYWGGPTTEPDAGTPSVPISPQPDPFRIRCGDRYCPPNHGCKNVCVRYGPPRYTQPPYNGNLRCCIETEYRGYRITDPTTDNVVGLFCFVIGQCSRDPRLGGAIGCVTVCYNIGRNLEARIYCLDRPCLEYKPTCYPISPSPWSPW